MKPETVMDLALRETYRPGGSGARSSLTLWSTFTCPSAETPAWSPATRSR
jgi:hypothetical protein